MTCVSIRAPRLLLSLLVAIQFLSPPCTSQPFPVEPWYQNLQHFGPTATDGWNARPMNQTSSFTFTLSNLPVLANQEFMFVSLLAQPAPPLGILNFKQGKIGVGLTIDPLKLASVNNNNNNNNNTNNNNNAGVVLGDGVARWTMRTLPGGGSGRYPASGTVTITVRTDGHPTRPLEVDLVYSEVTSTRVVMMALDGRTVVRGNSSATGLVASGFDPARLNLFGTATLDRFVAVNGSFTELYWTAVNATASAAVSVHLEYGGDHFWVLCVPDALYLSSGSFTPLVTLRHNDSPQRYFTPIHSNVIPSLSSPGRTAVLVTGWLRRDGLPCRGGDGPGGRRNEGATVIIHAGADAGVDPVIEWVDERGEYPFGAAVTQAATQENRSLASGGDVLYCAGHTTLRDGRVFYTGGARYANISSPYEYEWGLDYARYFDPATKAFSRARIRMPLGSSWYPTAGLLPDGRVLVTGAFTAYGTAYCVGDACTNPQINVFDPATGFWEVVLDKDHGDHAIDPGIREYTRVFVLPEPVAAGGHTREVLLMGKEGRAVLLALDPKVPMAERLFKPRNGKRPGTGCREISDQSTAVHLTVRGGELLVIGGCTSDDDTLQRADFYNVQRDEWTSVNMGVRRGVPASLLLPDGNVMVMSGESPRMDQNLRATADGSDDPRYIQIIDPETRTVMTESARSTVFRGYHNTAAVLRDGSVLIGGGFNQFGDVGCEEPTMHVFRPSYLSRGPRPAFAPTSAAVTTAAGDGKPFVIAVGATSLDLGALASGTVLHPTRGVALITPSAFTHSYDHRQRHIPLTIVRQSPTLVVNVPSSPMLFPGHYLLFLISDKGVPCEQAVHVAVDSDSHDSRKQVEDGLNNTKLLIVAVVIPIAIVSTIVGVLLLILTNKRKAHLQGAQRLD
jgi:hypothetical protein